MGQDINEFKNFSEYKNYIQEKIDSIYTGRNKIYTRELFSIFSEQLKQLNEQGLARIDSISEMDGDSTTVSKEEMMLMYSLLDFDISGKKLDGNLATKDSIMNVNDNAFYEEIKNNFLEIFNEYGEETSEIQNDSLNNGALPTDNTHLEYKLNIGQEQNKYNPEDYTYESLKEKFPETEYELVVKRDWIDNSGLHKTDIKKDGKLIASVYESGFGCFYNYDEHGKQTEAIFTHKGNIVNHEKNEYIYDERGHVIAERNYLNGKLRGGTYREYDENNHITFEAEFDGNNEQITTTQKTYKQKIKNVYFRDPGGDVIYSAKDQWEGEEFIEYLLSDDNNGFYEIDSIESEWVVQSEIVRDCNGRIITEESEDIKYHSPIADQIHEALNEKFSIGIYNTSIGLPSADLEKLKEAIYQLNDSNIEQVARCYKETYNVDIISALKRNGLSGMIYDKETKELLSYIKTLIAKHECEHWDNFKSEFLLKAMSGIPDTEFIEKILEFDDSSLSLMDMYIEQKTGKSIIQNIFNSFISNERKKQLITKYIDNKTSGSFYGSDDVVVDEKIRRAAYIELDRQLNKVNPKIINPIFVPKFASHLDYILGCASIEAFDDNINPNKLNGKIDQIFSQGNVGDCWLIASLMAIASTSNADKYFSDILSLDDLGGVKVKLKYPDEEYYISSAEAHLKCLRNGCAEGDEDIRAIEMALSKHLAKYEENNDKENALDGGEMGKAFWFLLGNDKFKSYKLKDININFIDKEFNNVNNAVMIGRWDTEHDINNAYNSKGELVTLSKKHAFTATRTDNKYLYFIDPNVGTEEYHIEKKDIYKVFDDCAIAHLE